MERRPDSLRKGLGQTVALLGAVVGLMFAVLMAGLGL